MESTQILLVSKELSVLDLPCKRSEIQCWQWETASSGWEALERVKIGPGPDLILLDLVDGVPDGLHTLSWLRRVRPSEAILVLNLPGMYWKRLRMP